jgi:H+/Cl- antiporter ClcA
MNKNLRTKDYWREQIINALLLGIFIGCFGGLFISSLLNWLDGKY